MKNLSDGSKPDKKILCIYIARFALQLLAILSIIVLIGYFLISLSAYFAGFSIWDNTTYGWEAVGITFGILFYVAWPLFVTNICIIVFALVYFNRTKGRYSAEVRKLYLSYTVNRFLVLLIICAGLFGLYVAGYSFFQYTYTGAKLLSTIGLEKCVGGAYTIKDFVPMDEVFLIYKNDEPIYLKGYDFGAEETKFLDDLYYDLTYWGKGSSKLPDMSDADEYIFVDEDGIYRGDLLKKGDYIIFDASTPSDFADEYCRRLRLLKVR